MGIFQQNWDFYDILIFVTIRLKCNKILILVKKLSESDFPSNYKVLVSFMLNFAHQNNIMIWTLFYRYWKALKFMLHIMVTEKRKFTIDGLTSDSADRLKFKN